MTEIRGTKPKVTANKMTRVLMKEFWKASWVMLSIYNDHSSGCLEIQSWLDDFTAQINFLKVDFTSESFTMFYVLCRMLHKYDIPCPPGVYVLNKILENVLSLKANF